MVSTLSGARKNFWQHEVQHCRHLFELEGKCSPDPRHPTSTPAAVVVQLGLISRSGLSPIAIVPADVVTGKAKRMGTRILRTAPGLILLIYIYIYMYNVCIYVAESNE